MRLSPHFTLAELCRSQTATRHGIDNTPDAIQTAALRLLAREVLEPVRNHFGIPFSPSSGFRCVELNRLIGSKDTSQHTKGEAADIEVLGVPNHVLASWIFHTCKFDQIILEYHDPDDPAAGWVHVSVKETGNRQEFLSFDGKQYKRLA
ncbi:D-Ala-D-Ala carboxypeptidase family metallohydrolase [Paremcibacter congregatus]|uniref:D-Ala-D-Ala carboxypeptidase family metallohydrolase n=1 Tax=Paremcibacter congregatus TaxID=2043170 RepID=UPI0030EF6A38